MKRFRAIRRPERPAARRAQLLLDTHSALAGALCDLARIRDGALAADDDYKAVYRDPRPGHRGSGHRPDP